MNLKYKKIATSIFLAIFLIILDRFFKILALNHLKLHKIDIIPHFFSLHLAKNYYIAFSIPFTGFLLNTLIIIIITFLLFFYLKSAKNNQISILSPLTLIIAGAISNLYDRIIYGFVIDYLDLSYFTVFNLADSMIVLSFFWILFYLKKEGGNNGRQQLQR